MLKAALFNSKLRLLRVQAGGGSCSSSLLGFCQLEFGMGSKPGFGGCGIIGGGGGGVVIQTPGRGELIVQGGRGFRFG